MSIGGTAAYDAEYDLPKIVADAVALAKASYFEYSCLPTHGRLLQILAKGRRGGRIGETGTGCGVGLAWLVSGADETTTIISVEKDHVRAAAASQLFKKHPNVKILSDDWKAIEQYAPFDLLILDGGGPAGPDKNNPKQIINPETVDISPLVTRGGAIVFDDYSTNAEWPRMRNGEVDTARMFWLKHPQLISTEIQLDENAVTIVGMRI